MSTGHFKVLKSDTESSEAGSLKKHEIMVKNHSVVPSVIYKCLDAGS